MKSLKVIAILLVALFLAVSAAEAKKPVINDREKYPDMIKAARETIWKAMTNGQNGSCATVAVMDRGRLVYSECFGAADRATNRPVDKNTRFNIGSTSKMFVAVAILLLVDEGKVALDEPIARYVTDFTMKDPRYRDITVRMIFNHSSGLPGSTFYFGYEPDGTMHRLLLDEMKGAVLKHAPGAMSMYCNDGFTLAEIIVERVSGKKYMDFLAERVFKPLGMKNSGASIGECGDKNIAEYYDLKTGKKHPPEVVPVYACGGLSSTAEDLCRFGNSFNPNGTKILSDASLAEIRRTQPTLFSDKLKRRQMMSEFGWEYSNIDEFKSKGLQAMGKGGNTQCYSTNLQVMPDEGISIGFITNGHVMGESITRPIIDGLLKDKGLVGPAEKPVKKPVEPQAVPEETLRFAGVYVKDADAFRVAFNKEKNGLEIYPLTEIPAAKGSGGKDKGPKEPAKPVLAFVYNGGFFHNFEKDAAIYFVETDGRQFIATSDVKPFGVDMIGYQKLEANRNGVSFKTDINGETWLVRNEKPYALAGNIGVGKTVFYEELPGHVNFLGLKKIETPDYAGMAATAFRDQSELRLLDVDGETWLKCSFRLFSPGSKARKLIPGVNRVMIKPGDHNEWLRVEKGAIVKFDKPEKARVAVVAGDDAIYDSVIDGGPGDPREVYAPEGSFIFFGGTSGDVFRIVAR